jgi:MYXO-CTERM domain-containing protein
VAMVARGLLAIAVILAPDLADACIIPANPAFVLDPAHADDHVPPGPVTILHSSLSPIRDYEGCDAQTPNSCSDLGTIGFSFRADDDRTPPGQLGVVVSVVEGELPPVRLGAAFSPVQIMDGGVVYVFGEAGQDIDFVLAISAIDLNGNVGPATEVRFSRGVDGSGCATGRHHAAWPLLAVAALLMRRRRRVRRPARADHRA